MANGERKKIIGIVAIFLASLGGFYLLKTQLNATAETNQQVLATAFFLEAAKEDIYSEDYFTKTRITEPLTQEQLLAKARALQQQAVTPQLLILENQQAFAGKRAAGTIKRVAAAVTKKKIRLLIGRSYQNIQPKTAENSDLSDFSLISSGIVGLRSQTIRYKVAVDTAQAPETFLGLLPAFVQLVESASDTAAYKSKLYIISRNKAYIFESERQNELTEIEDF